MTKSGQLIILIEDFIEKYNITCPEDIYQNDQVLENACDFIEKICEIVGYAELEDEV